MADATPTIEGYTAEQVREWTKYVATEAIFIGGARAFNIGDPVPASHVDRSDPVVSKDQVARVNTKAAAEATSQTPTA